MLCVVLGEVGNDLAVETALLPAPFVAQVVKSKGLETFEVQNPPGEEWSKGVDGNHVVKAPEHGSRWFD